MATDSNIKLDETVLRNIVRNTIKEALKEKFEVLKDNEAEDMCRRIYKNYLIKRQYNDKLPKSKKEDIITVHDWYSPKGNQKITTAVSVNVNLSDTTEENVYNGHLNPNTNDIYLMFNEYSMRKYETFRNVILHELTHVFDREHYDNEKGFYHYSLYNDLRNNINNPISSIIYRLWTPTERNAYTTYAYGKNLDSVKEYINMLETQINALDQNPLRYAKSPFWIHVAKMLLNKKYSSEDQWELAKDNFIKKSRMLLDRFKKKAYQRFGQHQDGYEDYQPDMKDVKFQASNYEMIDKLSDTFMLELFRLIKSDGDFKDWAAMKKQENPRLTNKLLKFIWDREFNKCMKTFLEEPEHNTTKIDWAKRHGYINNNTNPF